MIQNIKYNAPLGSSDHFVLTFDAILYIEHDSNPRDKYLYFKGNYEEMKKELSNVKWEEILSPLSSTEAWDVFADIIIDEIERNVPVSQTRPSPYKTPWMSKDALAAVRRKRTRWKKYSYNRNERTRNLYNEAKHIASRECKRAKLDYEKQIAAGIKNDPRSFWRYVQSKLKTKDKIEALQDSTQNLQYSSEEKAILLNNFFTSVFTQELDQNIPNLPEKVPDTILENIIINPEDVMKHLNALNITKSAGPDNMHPKLLRELSEIITEPLCIIFNKTIEDGAMPQCWKEANITPIFKKGEKSRPENYRPISLTSILVKILEKEVRKSLMEHMDRNNFFFGLSTRIQTRLFMYHTTY